MSSIFHEKQLNMFKAMKTNDTLSHAYLFSGYGGIGKLAFALSIAEHLQEEKNQKNNPDIIKFLNPPTIKQVRELKKQLITSPFISKYKIVIINNIDKIKIEAANALLKTLEEPRGSTIFILIAEHSQAVLETIRSRCYQIKFQYVSDKLIGRIININEIKDLELHWTGRPQNALRFLNDESYSKKIKDYKQDCDKFIKGGLAERFKISEKYAKMKNTLADSAQDTSMSSTQSISEILRIWVEHIRNKNIENKDKLISDLIKIYKINNTTNANIKFLFNNFALSF